MSRRFPIAAALMLFVVPCAVARAQMGFGVAAGLSAPMGDFGDVAESGYQLSGLATISAPLLPVSVRLEAAFSEFDYKTALFTSSAKARILSGTANAVLSSPGILGPYLIGGVGVYRASAVCSGCSSSSTNAGFNAGVGFKFGLTGFSAFLEARYHYIPGASDPTTGGVDSSTQFVPVTFGITF